MTNKHTKEDLTLKPYEAHLASLCVAIVSGGIGGVLVKWIIYFYSTALHLDINLLGFIPAAVFSFSVAWLVCDYLFPSAHKWYGHDTLHHRIYDFTGTVSGVLIYWVFN